MIAPHKHFQIFSLASIIISSAGQFTLAQQTNAVGLPVVQENYGLENPPDLPDLPSSNQPIINTAPAVGQSPDQPSFSSPANGNGNGGVLSTLDNLPPVGSSPSTNNNVGRSFTPQLPEPVRNQQNSARLSQNGRASQPQSGEPRIVRFGDVRNEAEALRQYPELAANRSVSGGDNRTAPRLPETQPPTGLAKYNPLRLLNRFNPLRMDKPEPPLVQKSVNEGDELVTDTINNTNASNRSATADRTDSEIQKRVDKIIRQEFGNKTNDFSVEVIDREVYIKARPNWFWQRRQLSDELQKLPGIESKRLHITVY
jgi:hypothetical protein